MGQYLSRNPSGIEQLDIPSDSKYIFPPKSNSYFASHFFIGGKKFETSQPEGYLFGDNSDLNYLGPKPNNFSYHSPVSNQPIRALKCLVNIRKDSLRLIRVPNLVPKPSDVIANDEEQTSADEPLYNLEFTFDADCSCLVTVYYNAAEEMRNKAVTFTTNSPSDRSETVRFAAGCNQQFCLPTHLIAPESLSKNSSKIWTLSCIPVAIQICAECGPEFAGHSHVTYAAFEKNSGENWSIKASKQKQGINGVCYLLQEIYGIENKNTRLKDDEDDDSTTPEDDFDEENSECIVCLSDERDTIILPCKHLCLCSTCANQLRFQQSGCPICRQSFRALLQIRAVRKSCSLSPDQRNSSDESGDTATVQTESGDNSLPLDVTVPSGYELVSLVSAINGPVSSAAPLFISDDDGIESPSASSSTISGRPGNKDVTYENETDADANDSETEQESPSLPVGTGEQNTYHEISETAPTNTDTIAEPASNSSEEAPVNVYDVIDSMELQHDVDIATPDDVVLGDDIVKTNDVTDDVDADPPTLPDEAGSTGSAEVRM